MNNGDDITGQDMRKHSVLLDGHRTSVSLEDAFWMELKRLAKARGISLNRLITEIDHARSTNLSSALRVYVLNAIKAGGAD